MKNSIEKIKKMTDRVWCYNDEYIIWLDYNGFHCTCDNNNCKHIELVKEVFFKRWKK